VGRLTDPGGPVPDRVVGVVAAGLVLDPPRLTADPPLADPDVALDRDGPLAGPDVAVLLAGLADHLVPGALAGVQEGADLLLFRPLGCRLDPNQGAAVLRRPVD